MTLNSNGYTEIYIESQIGIIAHLQKRTGQRALALKCNVDDVEWFGEVRPLHDLKLPGEPADFFIQYGLHVYSFECQGKWVQYILDPMKSKTHDELESIANSWNDKFKTEEDKEYFCMNPSCTEYLVPNSYECGCDGGV